MIRCLIIDDEDLARQIIREYLAAEPDIEVIGECSDGFEAVKCAGLQKPDLLFLDVQMPKLDGFEVLELVGNGPAVVFITAFDQYATKAFDAAAVDYLLKPFDISRFRTALERVRKRLGDSSAAPNAADLKNASRPPGQYSTRIVVKDGTKVHIIQTDSLDYVEAQDDYVALHSGGKAYLKQQTISSVAESLDPERFVRVHRSFLVNLDRVRNIEPYTKETRIAILTTGAQVPVSRTGFVKLRELMNRT
ncbi:MAG: LytTR family transcriptional regulator DNA-binding domain-containing protein [Acidobacteriaceae bacterium]|nr:LytTR family transcriptional regulator DNA-binding domain-containing protein [Acidobacteriaceae bacterium]MBV8572937.1 LytTR family transcriptional regulator DNA-binding domain-containing protein [Acidobacteriaceae bacterium]